MLATNLQNLFRKYRLIGQKYGELFKILSQLKNEKTKKNRNWESKLKQILHQIIHKCHKYHVST